MSLTRIIFASSKLQNRIFFFTERKFQGKSIVPYELSNKYIFQGKASFFKWGQG